MFKTIMWRIAAFISCYIILLCFGIEFWASAKLTIVMNIVHVAMYYGHERIWNSIDYGKEYFPRFFLTFPYFPL